MAPGRGLGTRQLLIDKPRLNGFGLIQWRGGCYWIHLVVCELVKEDFRSPKLFKLDSRASQHTDFILSAQQGDLDCSVIVGRLKNGPCSARNCGQKKPHFRHHSPCCSISPKHRRTWTRCAKRPKLVHHFRSLKSNNTVWLILKNDELSLYTVGIVGLGEVEGVSRKIREVFLLL